MSRLARGNGKAEGGKVKSEVFPLLFNLKFIFFLSQRCMRGPADANNLICYAWAIRRNLLVDLRRPNRREFKINIFFFIFTNR